MTEKVLMKGNEALAEAAMRAGCRFYAGYPITPQSEVSEYMSRNMPKHKGVFIPAESEIGAINMVLGAGASGALAMTSTASCAMALKQETIGYMVAQEVPCLIVNVSRGGPGLGSIAPSQGDYLQSTRGGANGDMRLIVLAPSTIQEQVDLVELSFDLSQKWRTPVILLSDGMIGQMAEPVVFGEYKPVRQHDQSWALTGAKERKPRNLKSIFLKDGELEKHNFKLFDKYQAIREHEIRCELDGVEDADILISAFGSCSRIAKSAIKEAREQGLKVGLIRPITCWPFPRKIYYDTTQKCNLVLNIEMNLGQMYQDVKMFSHGNAIIEHYGRPGGGVPTPEEILDQIKKTLAQHGKLKV